jgi:putative transposase
MKYQRGYKYALHLSGEQRKHFIKEFGCGRFVFNTLLERHSEQYKLFKIEKADKPDVSAFSIYKNLMSLKEEFPFLKEASFKTLHGYIFKLSNALTQFVTGKSRYPKFKSKNDKQSVTYHDFKSNFNLKSVNIKGQTILYLKVPKLKELIKVLWTRNLPSDPTQVTISRDTQGNFFASFLCERDPVITNGTSITGIDLGLKDIITSSDGSHLSSPKFYRQSEKRLAIAQRKLSKKKKGSKNRHKQRLKVAKIHGKIANQRNDYLHKLSRSLVNDNQVIGVESLRIAGIKRALKLGKSVSDTGLGTLIKYLSYKAEESNHCKVIMYPMLFPSTQVCSHCYHRLKDADRLTLNDRHWTCPKCNIFHDRDINAAKVIKEGVIRILKLLPEEVKHRHGVIISGEGLIFEELFPESLIV